MYRSNVCHSHVLMWRPKQCHSFENEIFSQKFVIQYFHHIWFPANILIPAKTWNSRQNLNLSYLISEAGAGGFLPGLPEAPHDIVQLALVVHLLANHRAPHSLQHKTTNLIGWFESKLWISWPITELRIPCNITQTISLDALQVHCESPDQPQSSIQYLPS